MSAINNDLILKDYSDKEVYLRNIENISYNTTKQKVMLDYNIELLKTVQ